MLEHFISGRSLAGSVTWGTLVQARVAWRGRWVSGPLLLRTQGSEAWGAFSRELGSLTLLPTGSGSGKVGRCMCRALGGNGPPHFRAHCVPRATPGAKPDSPLLWSCQRLRDTVPKPASSSDAVGTAPRHWGPWAALVLSPCPAIRLSLLPPPTHSCSHMEPSLQRWECVGTSVCGQTRILPLGPSV